MNRTKLQDITYKVVKNTDYEVAILPVGATEPHGLHLPYGIDTYLVERIAERACDSATRMGARVILLPTISYGVDANMLRFPLAINVCQSTLNLVATDIIKSLEHHGIPKLIILNGHGGNEFKPLQRDLFGQTKVFIALVEWWKVACEIEDEIFDEKADTRGDHADEMETSVALAMFRDLVHMEDADDGAFNQTRFEALNKGWAFIPRPWHLLTKDSGCGDPRKATPEKGEKYLSVIVSRISRFVKELSDAKMDEKFPYK